MSILRGFGVAFAQMVVRMELETYKTFLIERNYDYPSGLQEKSLGHGLFQNKLPS